VERFERDAATMPAGRDILYVSGRAASGEIAEATSGTMTQLFEVLAHLGSQPKDVVQVKAFIKPMGEWETVEREIEKSFGDLGAPPLVFVEWSSTSRATEIELIAAAPEAAVTDENVTYFTPPGDKSSPVYSRVARVHADTVIYTRGLYGMSGDVPAEGVKQVFDDLKKVAEAAGGDLRHLSKATYYVSDDGLSKALNEVRPTVYDPQRPPAASKVAVPTVGKEGGGLLMDFIAAPAAK
jgi:enamine deaminase RidA (YjgF/YER057c/UK114 family)